MDTSPYNDDVVMQALLTGFTRLSPPGVAGSTPAEMPTRRRANYCLLSENR